MTRPVTEILEQAQRENWPTSYIDAMANHHLCGGISRDYVNDCFSEPALGPEKGDSGSPEGCGPLGHVAPHPHYLDTGEGVIDGT